MHSFTGYGRANRPVGVAVRRSWRRVCLTMAGAGSLAVPSLTAPGREVNFDSTGTSSQEPASTVRAGLGLGEPGDEGRGATVAVVDTGVAEVGDLAGRVVAQVDVTGSGGGDGEGHGAFMAGLIAGSGAASDSAYAGVAPGAPSSLGAAPSDTGAWTRLAAAFDREDPAAVQKAWDALSPQAKSWAAKSWAAAWT